MKAQETGRKIIRAANSTVNIIVLAIILLLLAFAVYALWDSKQIHREADKSQYEIYKPSAADEGKSFAELQAINPEVFAWLTVFGTNIDYPVTQGADNMKYVNTNAEGKYSLSGAIFLDSDNSRDFSDFNSILYGHHMEKKKMFGEIESFSDRNVFDTYKYGNLYFDEKDHGIEFFAFLRTDAYDREIFAPAIKVEKQAEYIDNLLRKAAHTRDIGITAMDHIVLLSTCSSDSTNGRDILIGRITDDTFDDAFAGSASNDGSAQLSESGQSGLYKLPIPWQLLVLLLILLIIALLVIRKHCTRRKKRQKNES